MIRLTESIFGIPPTTATYETVTDADGDSLRDAGVNVSQVFFQENNVAYAGLQLGIETVAFIAKRVLDAVSITPQRQDKLTIDSEVYEVNDVMKEFNSGGIEDFYELKLIRYNE